jgi:8-oxo-dGTP diphosphatase
MALDPTRIIVVSAGIIHKGNKFLVAQRKKDTLLEPNKWEFPGGQVELYEDPKDCLVREIKEEQDIEISVDELIDVKSHVYELDKRYHVIMMVYKCHYVSGELKNKDCQDCKWVSRDELKNYALVFVDKELVEQHKDRL